MKTFPFSLFCLILFISSSCNEIKTIHIEYNSTIEQVAFAVSDLQSELISKNYTLSEKADFTIRFAIDESMNKSESYQINRSTRKELLILAPDANGLLYGGLELSELIRIGKDIHEIESISDQPYIAKRGIKFNIPLDIRTSSFDDSGDAAQENIVEMWNLEFWEELFDNMARHRYNAISFWNAHPFSSMVKLDDYPNVALQDVCGTSIKPQENPGYWTVPEMPSIKTVANLKVLKKMSIDEKIIFWQKVMKHAKNRGIDVYFITWNICLNGAAPAGSNKEVGDKKGKYGITNDYRNKTSIDYLRKSVKQFIINYPDLTGLGVTAGENMRTPMNDDDKEKWLWDTYGEGIMDAKAVQPNREIKFIHRFWWTDMKKITKYWGDYPDQFDMSFKYAKARLYSSVNTPFHKPLLDWMAPQNLKSWWNLRNDDIFIHRWGDPEYVSNFIKNMPAEQTAGFHMGSDGYVWGREFISKNPESTRQLEINKHWFRFMLWGRMGYNPNIPEQRFKDILASKFPEVDADKLLYTWKSASKIIPQMNRFHWRDWDYMWSPEACMEIWNDLRSVDEFRTTATMEGSGILNPYDYVTADLNKMVIKGITPIMVADSLFYFANEAIEGGKQLSDENNSKELKQTILDAQSMGYLGEYYANKILAAVHLEYFKQTGDEKQKIKAVNRLRNAVTCWESYRDINVNRYKKQNLARLRTFDFNDQLKWVKKEVDMTKNAVSYSEEKAIN